MLEMQSLRARSWELLRGSQNLTWKGEFELSELQININIIDFYWQHNSSIYIIIAQCKYLRILVILLCCYYEAVIVSWDRSMLLLIMEFRSMWNMTG